RGGGQVNNSRFNTDESGHASILWELGGDYNNELRVSIQGQGENTVEGQSLTVSAVSLYVYRQPEEINDGWETAAIDESVNLQSILDYVDAIRSGSFQRIHSLLMVKDGKLVFEEYWPGLNSNGQRIHFDRDTRHELQSASKSFRSALIGIAIDHGFIKSEDEKLFSFYPEYSYLDTALKDKITLTHVLTMSTGIEWHENDFPFSDSRNTLTQLYDLPSGEWSGFMLQQSMAEEPGTVFLYNTGTSLMLSDILTKVTGMRADHFSDVYLYNKMESGNQADRWPPLASGLRPRDMAKFGYVFLNNGR
ncbi:MAG: serine hydrolase, partial [bacterium]|nr:serine hydrolase [bacterium]